MFKNMNFKLVYLVFFSGLLLRFLVGCQGIMFIGKAKQCKADVTAAFNYSDRASPPQNWPPTPGQQKVH